MTTLVDIANELNISPSTVSKALNDKGRMSDDLRETVKDIAKRMNYHPNELARSLKTNSTNTIGVIFPDITNIFYGKMLRAINVEAKEKGYSVIFCDSNEKLRDEQAYFEMLQNKNVSGMIIATCGMSHFYDKLMPKDNVVFVDGVPSDSGKHTCISINSYNAAYTMTEYLIKKGFRDINMICGEQNDISTKERASGFCDCMATYGVCDRKRVYKGKNTFEGAKQVMETILSKTKPEAIICANNFLAYGALSGIREHGMNVPDDIAVACFDGIDEFDTMFIDLTSIIQPIEEIGRRAVELIIDKVKRAEDVNNTTTENLIFLEYVLHEGTSA